MLRDVHLFPQRRLEWLVSKPSVTLIRDGMCLLMPFSQVSKKGNVGILSTEINHSTHPR